MRRCEACGDGIPCPVPRLQRDGTLRLLCADCSGETAELMGGPRESGEAADRQYHGGQGWSGEW